MAFFGQSKGLLRKSRRQVTAKIAIFGLGDLGRRLLARLCSELIACELLICGRLRPSVVEIIQREHRTHSSIRFISIDLTNVSRVEELLRKEMPHLVVQCASLLSPWHLHENPSRVSNLLIGAGFAAQLSAQLVIPYSVMTAARAVDFRGHIVNCSFPDAVNTILGRIGLAPTIGIGNVAMIEHRVLAAMSEGERLTYKFARVLAHHSQVAPSMKSTAPADRNSWPRIFLGEDGIPSDEHAYRSPPLMLNRDLNSLTCQSAIPLLASLLPEGSELRTSAPGPFGLPGGYPIHVKDQKIELDLPPGWNIHEATRLQRMAARMDGIEEITSDGTVCYTADAASTLRLVDPALAEPLAPDQAQCRFARLTACI